MQTRTVCVVGNPNCGKTTLFNALTGSHQEVGNWPGVTVDKKVGRFTHRSVSIDLVDLPGIYSITPSGASGDDERIARDYILTGEAELVVNIIDASNLERNLYLTTQLIEMQVPMFVVVNMLDIAKQHRLSIDLDALSHELGCPVVGVVASREDGIEALKDAILTALENPVVPRVKTHFDERIERAVTEAAAYFREAKVARPEWFAMQFMEEAAGLDDKLPGVDLEPVKARVRALNDETEGDTDILVASARYAFVQEVADRAITRVGEVTQSLTEKIDRVVLNRWLGIPIFLLVMYVMFLFTQNVGGAFIDFFDILVGGVMVEGFGELLSSIGAPDWLRVFLANGVGGGLQTVSTFIPVVFFLYLFLAVLEDSGYMARAAFVMDRLMRALGLPGKAFVPLIVGFGCNVPAIMATRTMDRASDRIITVMMAPFMSCGARLPVYVLFATAFFPTNGQNLVFALYVIGIVAAILTGFLLKNTVLPGSAAHFVMEIPPYHIPTLKGVMLRTWERVSGFTVRAGQAIIVIVACLTFLNSMGTDGSFGNEDSDKSVLSSIGRTIVPVLEPMGVEEENWPAAVGIFTGIFAKEAVVGTLNSLYGQMAATESADEEANESSFSFADTLGEALTVTGENLAGLGSALTDPLGLSVGDLSDETSAAEEQEVSTGTIDTIRTLFASESAAFAYLLLVLLYCPCVAAMATILREVGFVWTVFSGIWTTMLGYAAATVFYRLVHFAEAPLYASTAIGGCLAALLVLLLVMKRLARRNTGPKVIPIVPKQ